MLHRFIFDLKRDFSQYTFTESILKGQHLFIYDTSNLTEMIDNEPATRHFKIMQSDPENEVVHICIDGDFIPKHDSQSLAFFGIRPDCLVFDKNKFICLELKVEQEDATWEKEDSKWKKFFEGARQILAFIKYLRVNQFEVKNYYSTLYGIICMRFEPNFSINNKSNAQRNVQLFKISTELSFEIKPHNHLHDFLF